MSEHNTSIAIPAEDATTSRKAGPLGFSMRICSTNANDDATPSIIGTTKVEPKHTYTSGATRSDRAGKGRYDLIPYAGLRRLAIRYEEGAAIHGDRNWEKGFPLSRCISSAIDHLYRILDGEGSEDHAAAAAWQCFAYMFFESEIEAGQLSAELNDLPRRKRG